MLKSFAAKAANLTHLGLSLAASAVSATNAQEQRLSPTAFKNLSTSSPARSVLDASRPDSTHSQSMKSERSDSMTAPRTNQIKLGRADSVKPSIRETPPVQPSSPTRSIRDIRVLVAESSSMQIATSEPSVIRNGNGEAVARLQPNQMYWATENSQGIQIGNGQFSNDLWIEAEHGLVWVNDRVYAGRVHLIDTGQSLLAVNAVNLETYLTSVVGAEMPSNWHPEALKAQAISARSYAIALMQQPSSDWYDLVNDERSQVYLGLESVTPETITAVQSTQNQVLVQNGKILMAEYASTQEVTQSAHAGRGMSQTIAQNLAATGRSHLQVLGQFYQGAELATLL